MWHKAIWTELPMKDFKIPWGIRRVHTFPGGIIPKGNVIAWLGLKLAMISMFRILGTMSRYFEIIVNIVSLMKPENSKCEL